jgi:hypothetical protein
MDCCRVAAKIDGKRRTTLTSVRRVAGACQSSLHKSTSDAGSTTNLRLAVSRLAATPHRRRADLPMTSTFAGLAEGDWIGSAPRRRAPRLRRGWALCTEPEPHLALTQWLHRYTEFIGTKRGLAAALHSGDPAFDSLPGYFMQRLEPVVGSLLDAATATGEIRPDVNATELLHAVALQCQPVPGEDLAYNQRIVAILTDGLRCVTDKDSWSRRERSCRADGRNAAKLRPVRQQSDDRVDQFLGGDVPLVPDEVAARLEARDAVGVRQQQRPIASRLLGADDAPDDIEEQIPRAFRRPDRRRRIAGRRGEHEAVQVRPGAADADQRQQRGAQGPLGRVVAVR